MAVTLLNAKDEKNTAFYTSSLSEIFREDEVQRTFLWELLPSHKSDGPVTRKL